MKNKKGHCEKCSHETEEGWAISGCAYCGCHETGSPQKKYRTAVTGFLEESFEQSLPPAPQGETEKWEEEFDKVVKATMGVVADDLGKGMAMLRVILAAARKEGEKLGNELCAILTNHCGERGDSEGSVETLNRIIKERKQARLACLQEVEKEIEKLKDKWRQWPFREGSAFRKGLNEAIEEIKKLAEI